MNKISELGLEFDDSIISEAKSCIAEYSYYITPNAELLEYLEK